MTEAPGTTIGPDEDRRRCWGCRDVWPRAAMDWGSIPTSAPWYARAVRVLRCPDCLA